MKRIIASLTMAAILIFAPQMRGEQAKACCSLRRAEFTATKGYVGEARRKGQVVHLLAYQNMSSISQGGLRRLRIGSASSSNRPQMEPVRATPCSCQFRLNLAV